MATFLFIRGDGDGERLGVTCGRDRWRALRRAQSHDRARRLPHRVVKRSAANEPHSTAISLAS